VARVPIAEGLFTGSAERPQLIGSRCQACAQVTFPRQPSCPACTGDRTEEILLSRRGVLWTWTIQRFPPPAPPFAGDRESFEPFGVGYVELPEGLRVEARLTESDPEALAIGMPMELVLEPFDRDAEGNERMTFAFRPLDGEGG
jgi:uncharacterized OB-fold protein